MNNSRIILTRAQAREADRIAIEKYGIPGLVLMENAGRGAAEFIIQQAGARRAAQIFCGPGNNGGDGYVIARHLAIAGVDVRVILACDRERVVGDAAVNLRILEKMQLPIEKIDTQLSGQETSVVVDALLGTGASGDPRGHIAKAIDRIDSLRGSEGATVFAIDIPSGLDADTGVPGNPTVRADHTITFMGSKLGFTFDSAKPFIGRVYIAHIGIPVELIGAGP